MTNVGLSLMAGKKVNNSNGFSLIEVAIGLMIVGLILVPMLHLMEAESKRNAAAKAEGTINAVGSALNQYLNQKGHYPIPADRDTARGDADYGTTVAIAGVGACAATTAAVCRADIDGNVLTTNDRVLIGAVPFVELGLSEKQSLDEYGNKLTYAVSEVLTNVAGYSETAGVISVINQTGSANTSTDNPASTHYIVVGHGRDRGGAYSPATGALVEACGAPGVEMDNENCDNDGVFRAIQSEENGILIRTQGRNWSLAQGLSYFDDLLFYSGGGTENNWALNPTTNDMMTKDSLANIGIGIPDSETPYAKLDVNGQIMADSIDSPRLCSYAPNSNYDKAIDPDCVRTSDLTTDPEVVSQATNGRGVNCGATNGMSGVRRRVVSGDGRADEICDTPRATTNIGNCPAGTYPTRIVGGVLNCI